MYVWVYICMTWRFRDYITLSWLLLVLQIAPLVLRIAILGYLSGFFPFDWIALRVQVTSRQVSVNHEWDNRAGRCRYINTDKQKRHSDGDYSLECKVVWCIYTIWYWPITCQEGGHGGCESRRKAKPPTYNKALAAGTPAAARLCDGYFIEEAAQLRVQ